MDIGTAEGKEPQKTVDFTRLLSDALVEKGWKLGIDLSYTEAESAVHNEKAWSQRIGPILEYLFEPERNPPARPRR